MNQEKNTFKKAERLNSINILDELFGKGDSFLIYPLKVVYLETIIPSKFPVQVLFSVGKRNFKNAVDRNLLKRRLRESYRLQKRSLYESLGEKKIALAFIYVAKEKLPFSNIDKSMKIAISKLGLDSGIISK